MRFHKVISLAILLAVFVSTSCSKGTVQQSSPAGALTANDALDSLTARPFERHMLNSTGFHTMNNFIRPDVRGRMDEEPVGDSDGGYDPQTLNTDNGEEPQGEAPNPEVQTEEIQPDVPGEDASSVGPSDSMKFSWARKAYGEAIKANPTANGVIVLYADENYYDINSLMTFIEDGRNRIADRSTIDTNRIQVVFGGYRGTPQVELWVVPQGGPMPEFKQDDRNKANEPGL